MVNTRATSRKVSLSQIASYDRSYVYAFAEQLHSLWEGVSDYANQPFIPRKSRLHIKASSIPHGKQFKVHMRNQLSQK